MSAPDWGDGAVVAGVDGSDTSLQAVRWAADLAARRRLPLAVVYGYGLLGRYYAGGDLALPADFFEAVEQDARRVVSEAAEEAEKAAPDVRVDAHAWDGLPVPFLTELSRRAVMIVLGASGRGGFTGMLAGSTAVGVVSHAESPVVIVRNRADETTPPTDGPVVVGVDGSPLSERAIAHAFEEASLRGVPLVALHAWLDLPYQWAGSPYGNTVTDRSEDEKRLLAERLAGWQEQYPDVPIERVVVRDRPRDELLAYSATAQLVVVGSRGRGGFTGLVLGSTSQALVHHAQCPVMVARTPAEK